MRLGGRVSDIGHAVQQHVEAHGFSVVREFVGHGIGAALHEEPQIANYGEPGRGPRLAEGMVLAIEPMVNIGRPAVKVLADGWTAVTQDGSLSAHFEHTVAVTTDGPLVLTRRTRRRRSQAGSGGRLEPNGRVRRTAADVRARTRARRIGAAIDGRGHRAGGAAERAVPRGDRAGSGRWWRTRRAGPGATSSGCSIGDRVRLELSPRDLTRGRIVDEDRVRGYS